MATPRNVSAFKMPGETANCGVPLLGGPCKIVSCLIQCPDFKIVSRFAPNAPTTNELGVLKNTQMSTYALAGKRKAFGKLRYRVVGPIA